MKQGTAWHSTIRYHPPVTAAFKKFKSRFHRKSLLFLAYETLWILLSCIIFIFYHRAYVEQKIIVYSYIVFRFFGRGDGAATPWAAAADCVERQTLAIAWKMRWVTFAAAISYWSPVNSASYPQRDGKWVVAYGLQGEGLVWLIGAVLCLLAANRASSCSLTRAMDGRIMLCGMISSCQSAATSEIVKRFWSRVWLM